MKLALNYNIVCGMTDGRQMFQLQSIYPYKQEQQTDGHILFSFHFV